MGDSALISGVQRMGTKAEGTDRQIAHPIGQSARAQEGYDVKVMA